MSEFERFGGSAMSWRSDRAAEKAEARRRADRELLDSALAPYLLELRAAVAVGPVAEQAPAEPAAEPLTVSVRVGTGATIDILRSPTRAGVIRLRRRPLASLAG
jgi:hypothetical protein